MCAVRKCSKQNQIVCRTSLDMKHMCSTIQPSHSHFPPLFASYRHAACSSMVRSVQLPARAHPIPSATPILQTSHSLSLSIPDALRLASAALVYNPLRTYFLFCLSFGIILVRGLLPFSFSFSVLESRSADDELAAAGVGGTDGDDVAT